MIKKLTNKLCLVSTISIILFSHNTFAASKLECLTNVFAPFGFVKDGKPTGIEVDLLQEIGKRLNIEIKLQVQPWKRIIHLMQKGKTDCMFAAFLTEERLEFMDYTHVPFHISSLTIFVQEGKEFPFKTISDLKGKTIGLIRGFKTTQSFDQEKGKTFKVYEVNNMESNFQMLAKGSLDAVVVNNYVGIETMRKIGIANIHQLPVPISAKPAFLTFSKDRNLKHLVPQFDKVIFDILADGTYQKIFKKYIKD